jgi:hypothetical protein
VRPGRSSADGGIDELPLFRDASRSRRATLAARPATCPASRKLSVASAWITVACIAITASRAASSGIGGTGHHDQGNPAPIKPTRWAGPGEIHGPAPPRSACLPAPRFSGHSPLLARSATFPVKGQGQPGKHPTAVPYLA